MRKLSLLPILLMLVHASFGQVNDLEKKDREAIQNLLSEQQKSWNDGDIDAFMEGYWRSEKLVFVGSGGAAYGWETTRLGYHKRYPDKTAMGILTFQTIELIGIGKNHARLIGTFHLKRTIGDLSGTFTLILYRFKDGWKIISDQTSSDD